MKTRFSTIPLTGLISAEFLSLIGNQVAAIAIPILVLQQTHSTFVTSIALLGNSVPFVVAALIGGKLIDKFGAWQISMLADVSSFISVLALPIMLVLDANNISWLLIISLIFLGSLFDPTGIAARHTFVTSLSRLAGKRLDHVNALRGGLENAADFIGPVVGIALISLINITNTFFVNALSFLLSAIIFACTVSKKRTKTTQKFNTDIFSGLRFVFKNPQLKILAVVGMITGFVIASFLGLLLLILATEKFHTTSLFAISLSAFSISATLSALLFSKLNRLYSYSFIYYVGLLIIGIGICLCGIAATQYGVVFAAILAGAAGAGNPLEQTILQRQTSKQNAGQVFTALPAIRFLAGSFGLIVTGLLTEKYSVTSIIIIEGCVLIIASVCGWFIAPLKVKNG